MEDAVRIGKHGEVDAFAGADVPDILLADGQVLRWTGPRRVLIDAATLPGVALDDAQAQLTGDWGRSATLAPYVGDGYLHQRAPNAADRSTVLSLDEERTVPAGTFGSLLLTEDTSTLDVPDPVVVRRAYAQGTGLVEETTTVGGTERAVLASVATP